MRSTYLIAGAIVLALVAAGVLFGTDFFRKNPFSGDSGNATATATSADDTGLVAQMNEIAAGGGIAATFSDGDAKKWILSAGHRLERFSLDSSGGVFARLTSTVPLDKANLVEGLVLEIPIQFAQRSSGKRIQIGIVARQPINNAADTVSIVYATRQAGNSGWQTLPISRKFELKTFEFDVPSFDYTNKPIIALHGDSAGSGRAVEIIGVYAKVK